MALGNVFMTDVDGNISSSSTSSSTEKVCGLLFDISGQADFWTTGQGKEAAEYLQDTVVELNAYTDAAKLGIVAYNGGTTEESSTDSDGNTTTVTVSTDFLAGIPDYHIKQFFSMAGGSGRLFVAFADCSSDWNALIDMQKASGGIINQFGIWTEQYLWTNMDSAASTYTLNLVQDINNIAQEMADDYFSPASFLLSANPSKVKTSDGSSNEVVFSMIPSCIVDARYVTVLLGQSQATDVKTMQTSLTSTTPVGTIGLALGTLTQCSVGESLAWVQEHDLVSYVSSIELGFGDSTIENGVLVNATPFTSLTKAQADDLDDKGYVFLRTYAGLEGHVYYTKDITCSDGDFCTIARNRTINKSRRLVRAALLPYVNSPVKLDPSTGQLSSGQITEYTNLITDCLDSMEDAGEISGVGTVSVPSDQNVLVTKKLQFSYTLVPLGCAESIEVEEGLVVSQ